MTIPNQKTMLFFVQKQLVFMMIGWYILYLSDSVYTIQFIYWLFQMLVKYIN